MKKCPFCHRMAKLTCEHLWSAWIGRLLGESPYAFGQRDSTGTVVKQWTSSGLEMKARAVCAPCNNGWMSRLEQACKPHMSGMILDGKRMSIDSDRMTLISCFAFKTAVIADCTANGRNPFFTTLARHRFARSLAIPDGVQIWIASFRDPLGHSGFFLSRYVKLASRTRSTNGVELYVFTYTAGFLALQVVAMRWLNPLHISRYTAPVISQNPIFDRFSVPIWPLPKNSIVWPPPRVFTCQEEIYQFSERWRTINLTPDVVAVLGL